MAPYSKIAFRAIVFYCLIPFINYAQDRIPTIQRGTWSYRVDSAGDVINDQNGIFLGTYRGALPGADTRFFDSRDFLDYSYHERLPSENVPSRFNHRLNFRIKFPENYDAPENASRVYPMMVFMHGAGERGNCWPGRGCHKDQNPHLFNNNDHQLHHGGGKHLAAVKLAGQDPSADGAFDGFLLYPQNRSGWISAQNGADIEWTISLIEKIIDEFRVDHTRIYMDGLSNGADAQWEVIEQRPDLIAAISPQSGIRPKDWSRILHIPVWQFQGNTDPNPTPSFTESQLNGLRAAGGTPKYTLMNGGHGIWDAAYAFGEPGRMSRTVIKPGNQFFDWFEQFSKLTIHSYYGIEEVCEGDVSNVRLGISPGFEAYEWKKIKGGVETSYPPASPETPNEIVPDEVASYAVRYRRKGVWTAWSDPFEIRVRPRPTVAISAQGSTMLPGLDGANSVLLSADETAGSNYKWYKNGVLVAEGPGLYEVTVYQTSQPWAPNMTEGDYYVVVTDNQFCDSNPSNVIRVLSSPYTGILPPKPADFTALADAENSISLFWTDGEDEDGYELYRSTSPGGPYVFVNTIPSNSIYYRDSLLEASTTYYYRLRAYNANGPSVQSDEISVTTPADNVPPTAPGDLTFVGFNYLEIREQPNGLSREYFDVELDKVRLSWDPSEEIIGLDEYRVYFADGTLAGTTTDTTILVTGLQEMMDYQFYVVALDRAGNQSPQSNMLTVSTVLDGLYFHMYIAGTWNWIIDFSDDAYWVEQGTWPDFDQAKLWEQHYDNTQYYAIDFFGYIFIDTPGNYTFYTSSDDGSQLWIDGQMVVNNDGRHGTQERSGSISLAQGRHSITVKYFQATDGRNLRVRWNPPGPTGKQDIPTSVLRSYDTYTPPVAPVTPVLASVAPDAGNGLDLSWTHADAPSKSFEVYRSESAGTSFNIVHTTATGVTTFNDNGLNPGTEYFYRLKAIDTEGSSEFSNEMSNTTAVDSNPPPAPTGLTAESFNDVSVALSWNAPVDDTGISGYDIYVDGALRGNIAARSAVGRSSSLGSVKTKSHANARGNTPSTSALINGLQPETTYEFVVVAKDLALNSSDPSAPLNVQTAPPSTPLPVEFVAFYGEPVGNDVILHWSTATEINNDHFTVERSLDGFDFTPVGTVKGAGNSSQLLTYSFNDPLPARDNFYRVKQTDFDGTFDYSDVIRVTMPTSLEWVVYPNPTSARNINIRVIADRYENRDIEINLVDLYGRSYYHTTLADFNDTSIKLSVTKSVPPGLYFVIMSGFEEEVQQKLLIE